jgi:hypothetical protein
MGGGRVTAAAVRMAVGWPRRPVDAVEALRGGEMTTERTEVPATAHLERGTRANREPSPLSRWTKVLSGSVQSRSASGLWSS